MMAVLDTNSGRSINRCRTSNKSGDVNDVAITGDDVANKIDSFWYKVIPHKNQAGSQCYLHPLCFLHTVYA